MELDAWVYRPWACVQHAPAHGGTPCSPHVAVCSHCMAAGGNARCGKALHHMTARRSLVQPQRHPALCAHPCPSPLLAAFYGPPTEEAQGIAVIQRALELGVTMLDTSDM